MSQASETKTNTILRTLGKINKIAIQEYPWFLFGILILTLVLSAAPYMFSFVQGIFVDRLVDYVNLGSNTLKSIYTILGVFVGVYLIQEIIGVFLSFIDRRFGVKIDGTTSLLLLKKKGELSVADYDNSEIWSSVTKATEAQGSIRATIYAQNQILKQIISLVIGAVIVARFSGLSLLIALLASAPSAIISFLENNADWKRWLQDTTMRKHINYIYGLFGTERTLAEMKFFQVGSKLTSKWDTERKEHIEKKIFAIQNRFAPLFSLASVFSALGYMAIFYILTQQGIKGEISIGDIIFYISSIFGLSNAFSGLLSSIGMNYQNVLKLKEYVDFLEIKPSMVDGTNSPVQLIHPPLMTIKDLYFGYQDKKVLKGVSAIIKPGEKIAIVGLNGAGKTTLIKMITKVYNPDSGSIKINEHDLEDLASSWWYGHLGVLSQEYTNYSFTVEESIAVGSNDPMNEDRVIESAKLAQIHDTIMELPLGYKTQLGRQFKDGHNFSIGQWQKLAIARALYRKPKVLILDEPTSAVDAEAEEAIFNNLHDLSKETTLIFVSHRFSTIRRADRILLVSDGKISEQGAHEDLMKMKGEYSRLFTLQAKSYQ
ncbi:MAG TPA: ABC transporter ATP-binding protein [Candidatus Paceibacterota bacterium]